MQFNAQGKQLGYLIPYILACKTWREKKCKCPPSRYLLTQSVSEESYYFFWSYREEGKK